MQHAKQFSARGRLVLTADLASPSTATKSTSITSTPKAVLGGHLVADDADH